MYKKLESYPDHPDHPLEYTSTINYIRPMNRDEYIKDNFYFLAGWLWRKNSHKKIVGKRVYVGNGFGTVSRNYIKKVLNK